MRLFPSERERQASDSRTVGSLFRVMFLILVAYGFAIAGRYLLGWW